MPKAKITRQEFQKRIQQRFPEECFEIIEYDSLGKPGKFKCCQCNNIIEVNKANNFLAKNKRYGCKNCHGLWKDREEKLNKIKEKYDIVKTEVKETHTYYTVKCKKCKHERTTTLTNLVTHLRCGCETGVYRNRTPEELIQQINEATSEQYELIGEYCGQQSKIKLRHSCGMIIQVWSHDAVAGKISCPRCHREQSRGERVVSNYLIKQNIPFEQEKQLENSRQHFDFFLQKENLQIAIEYNGEQHYKENNFFEGSLQTYQERDQKKREYCKKHNILLYEIPYTLSYNKVRLVLQGIINKFNDYPNGVDSSESKSCLSVDTDKDIVSSSKKLEAVNTDIESNESI